MSPPPPDDRPASAPGRVPSLDEIAAIIATPGNPSLRNLRITACYAEISREIAARLGRENVNWCTFATWASRTAGRFIRLGDFEPPIRATVQRCLGSTGPLASLRSKLRPLSGGFNLLEECIVRAARELTLDTSAAVAAGNLSVFAELAPLFSAMLSAWDQGGLDRPAAVAPLIASLQPGATSDGGQDLLRRAVSDYAEAGAVRDPRARAERILRANAQVGGHEQIRLQPHIHNAMTASLADRVSALLLGRGRPPFSPLPVTALIEARLRPHRLALEQVWLEIATEHLMTLDLPDGALHLGRAMPPPPGRPIFPPDLASPQDDELRRILRLYQADGPAARNDGATVWSNLSDRMRYILELFRSRQQEPSLFTPPFSPEVLSAIGRGVVPRLGV